ncbi:MAG: hypothetical protein ACE5EA_08545, partial [Nitrospirota bacterium]
NKITNQKFDNELIKNKINEIKNYHSSVLHWNLKEIKKKLFELIQKAKSTYHKIGKQLGVEFRSEQENDFSNNQKELIENLLDEANENNFLVIIEKAD